MNAHQRPIPSGGSPAETCDREAGDALALVQRLGCSDSPMRSEDVDGARREFDFVCSGQRTPVIKMLAAISSQIFAVAP